MSTKRKELLSESPMVEFNLRAAKINKFFDQYEAIHQKHKMEMAQIVKEFEAMKAEKRAIGFKGDDWMQEEE